VEAIVQPSLYGPGRTVGVVVCDIVCWLGVSGRGRVSGHTADFLLFSKRTATGPSCGKFIHVPHLRVLRGCSLVSSKLLKSRKSAACPETPPVRNPPPLP